MYVRHDCNGFFYRIRPFYLFIVVSTDLSPYRSFPLLFFSRREMESGDLRGEVREESEDIQLVISRMDG